MYNQIDLELLFEQIDCLNTLNSWNIEGRYPDFKNKLYKIATKEYVEHHIYGFLNMLRQNNIHITRVVLFGSFAKGNPHAYSDIDLAVCANEFSGYALIDVDLLIPSYRLFGGI